MTRLEVGQLAIEIIRRRRCAAGIRLAGDHNDLAMRDLNPPVLHAGLQHGLGDPGEVALPEGLSATGHLRQPRSCVADQEMTERLPPAS